MRSVMVLGSATQFPEKNNKHTQNGTRYRNGPFNDNCLGAPVFKRLMKMTPDDEVYNLYLDGPIIKDTDMTFFYLKTNRQANTTMSYKCINYEAL